MTIQAAVKPSRSQRGINVALELVLQKTDFLTYRECGTDTNIGYYGCTGVINYKESAVTGDGEPLRFYYHEGSDQFIYIGIFDNYEYPGWRYNVYFIDASTGNTNNVFRGYGGLGAALQLLNQGPMCNGPRGKIYSYQTGFAGGNVMETSNWQVGLYTAYELANPILTTAQIPALNENVFMGPIISWINDRYVQLGASGLIESFSISTGTKLYEISLPELYPAGTAWEDDERAWFLAGDNIFNPLGSTYQCLVKYNYRYNEVELVTEMQKQAAPDVAAFIAYDTRRKKLAAVRFKADASDGRQNNSFEIYAPQPVMSAITVPVSIDLVAPGADRSHFITTLHGTRGESGGNRLITVSVSGSGSVAQNEVFTQDSGTAMIEYSGATPAASNTITVSHEETRSV